MDKLHYLENSLEQINSLLENTQFKNQLYQVRSRAILDEFGSDAKRPDFTFESDQIWRYCSYIFSETTLLLAEGVGERTTLLSRLKEIAEAFEFLAKFASQDNEEILLINAALCYHLAGYQANALCISKLMEKKFLNRTDIGATVDLLFAFLYRQSMIDFLKRDVASLRTRANDAIRQIQQAQDKITLRVAEGKGSLSDLMDITAHGLFHQAMSAFVQFCLIGEELQLERLASIVDKSGNYFRRAGDVRLGTITSELAALVLVFRERSTWKIISKYSPQHLQNSIWRAYLRNLALKKSIVEFWPAQVMAVQSGLLTNDDSYVVQMPTSAGKTFVAELAMLATLTNRENVQCLYIAPYRALVNEIEAKLSETLGAVGYRVSTLIGGFEFDVFQEFMLTNSDVVVATPEKIELLLRTHPEFFKNLKLVVIDEGHMIDESTFDEVDEDKSLIETIEERGTLGRGILLEVLISRLKMNFSDIRFIFLSAVMPEVNAQDFVNWLSDTGKAPLRIQPEQRPSRQVLAKFEWRKSRDDTMSDNGELEYTSIEPLAGGKHPYVPYFITRKKYFTGELTPKRHEPKTKTWPASITNKAQSTAMLAAKFAQSGPTLVFCAEKGEAGDIVDNVVTTLKYLNASDQTPHQTVLYHESPDLESYYFALEWLGEKHSLTEALKYGVGMHIGSLPDPVRQAIERDYSAGRIRILVSTNTLAQGVNLPIKTAIIYSLERAWVEKDEAGEVRKRRSQLIKRRDFWNVCGRAGRAGKETEGQVVFVQISHHDAAIFRHYRDLANIEEVDSVLYKLLLALIEQRISSEELIGYLDSHILALLAEEVVDTADGASIEQFLLKSLVGVQAIRNQTKLTSLVSAMRTVSDYITLRVPEKERIRVFASTGLKLSSCEILERSVERFLAEYIELDLVRSEATDVLECNPLLIKHAFDACTHLEEMRPDRKLTVPTQTYEFFEAWLKGVAVRDLRASYWGLEIPEDFGRYISDQLTYKLPWGANGFLRVLASRLNASFADLPRSWQHLPAMIKFGVDNVIACWMGSIGVTSRSFARTLANIYIKNSGLIDFPKFALWIVNLPREYVLQDVEGNKFEKQQFFEARDRLSIDRSLYQHILTRNTQVIAEVRGNQYEGRQEFASQVQPGDELELVPEPFNQYDQNAVQVRFRGIQIGYIEREKAKLLAYELDLGTPITIKALDVDHPADQSRYPFSTIRVLIGFQPYNPLTQF